jgi:hypothetical protein
MVSYGFLSLETITTCDEEMEEFDNKEEIIFEKSKTKREREREREKGLNEFNFITFGIYTEFIKCVCLITVSIFKVFA